MIRSFTFSAFVLFLALSCNLSAQQASSFTGQSDPSFQHPGSADFVPGEILVKFKDEIVVSSGNNLKSSGISSVDQIIKANGSGSLEKLFPAEKKLKSLQVVKDPYGQDMKIPSLHNIYKITLSKLKSAGSNPTDIFKFIEDLKSLPEVEYAEPNYIYSIGDFTPNGPEMTMADAMKQPGNSEISSTASGLVPNDPLYNSQWGIPATNIDKVWNTTTGDSTSIIAILDTGIDWLHPDLAANIWSNKQEIPGNGKDDDGNGKIDDIRGWDFINNDNNPTDDNSHGTHCAGIAAAVGNNGIGIAGANWRAKIMPVKVFQSSGKGDAATIALGVNYAANKGATVINMSFGSYAESITLKNALANAYATAVLVAAAGNDGLSLSQSPLYPAAYSFILGVEANTTVGRAEFSNYDGDGPAFSQFADLFNYELKAPGTTILSCVPGGNYREYNGTSMAAPLVAGAVSLYRKIKPNESKEMLFGNFINSIKTHFDLDKAINIVPEPKLQILSYSLKDNIDGDLDGRPDANETIELFVKVRNTWGQANDVKVGVEFGEFEDKTTATIINPEAIVGSLSAYSSLSNIVSLKLKIDSKVANNRDIIFNLKTWHGNKLGLTQQKIVLNIENGTELSGVLSNTKILTPDKFWIISGSFKIAPTGNLILKPGTRLQIKSTLINDGTITGIGKQDSIIYITGTSIQSSNSSAKITLKYAYLELNDKKLLSDGAITYHTGSSFEFSQISLTSGSYGISYSYDLSFKDCIYYNSSKILGSGQFIRTNFDNIKEVFYGVENQEITYCNFIPVKSINTTFGGTVVPVFKSGNNILTGHKQPILYAAGGYSRNIPNQYWGTRDSLFIENKIYDFNEDATLEKINFSPYRKQPSDSAHAIVWKILVNGKDAQDELVDPVGVGKQRFDIYFNRMMDKNISPLVSFGVRYPYKKQIVDENGSWSGNGKIYTVYETIQLTTGDGINRIRVSGAKEINGWNFEIPIEDQRFEFTISAAGSASADFLASSGLGKVKLEWNGNNLTDGLGYNMYRMENVNDSVLTKPVLINSTLISDTLYTDFAVTPNKKYYYYYKILRTNLAETDSSKVVSATPFTASKGDANGDLSVNVLDVTTIVSYLLNQNPQPFIFEAADMNNDKTINILDVIAAVNKITGGGKKSVVASTNIPPAFIYLDKNEISFKTQYPVSALQFELVGSDIENITLSSKQKGLELVYSINNGKISGILFSFDNKSLPTEMAGIINIQGDCSGLKWGNLLGGDARGNPVKVIPDELHSYSLADCGLSAYPNPFSQSTTIKYSLHEAAQIQLQVYDIYGRLVETLLTADQSEGDYQQIWRGSSSVPRGIYFCRLTAKSVTGKSISKAAKLLRIGQ